MIDPTLRLERLAQVSEQADTGVLLLDVVLGHGAEPDPSALLAPAIAQVPQPVVVSLVGTANDPQDRDRQASQLAGAGRGGPPLQRRRHPPRRRAPGRWRLMDTPTAVVTVGTDLLAAAVESQAVPVTRVDWRPPMAGTEDDLVAVAIDPLRADANARALAAMLEVQATLVDVAPASEVLGLERGEFLHAGPPIAWDRASGPLRGALMGGAALEGLVEDPEDARRPVRVRLVGVPGTLPPPRCRRADGRASSRRRCGCGCWRTPAPVGVRSARSTRAWARCSATAPTGPMCSSGCAG